jgi:hypothetical protein
MNKVIVIMPMVIFVAACSSTPKDEFDKRVAVNDSKREAAVEKSISKVPAWMTELPASNNAVYANGTAVSSDMAMADYKAKLIAYGKICMAAGGKLNQEGKIFIQDSNESTAEVSELAIRSMCPSVDITGVETKEIKRIAEGGRFRTYALVVLPTGDANSMRKSRDQLLLQGQVKARSDEVFKQMDTTR